MSRGLIAGLAAALCLVCGTAGASQDTDADTLYELGARSEADCEFFAIQAASIARHVGGKSYTETYSVARDVENRCLAAISDEWDSHEAE